MISNVELEDFTTRVKKDHRGDARYDCLALISEIHDLRQQLAAAEAEAIGFAAHFTSCGDCWECLTETGNGGLLDAHRARIGGETP